MWAPIWLTSARHSFIRPAKFKTLRHFCLFFYFIFTWAVERTRGCTHVILTTRLTFQRNFCEFLERFFKLGQLILAPIHSRLPSSPAIPLNLHPNVHILQFFRMKYSCVSAEFLQPSKFVSN